LRRWYGKSTFVADKNEQVIFRVARMATKPEIKAAELPFKAGKHPGRQREGQGKAFRPLHWPPPELEKGLRLS
jgi:large subunit ribosomal protein L23